MIIRCNKCGTKYRFDESLLTGDGMWMRCSRCKNLFFQRNISTGEPYVKPVPDKCESSLEAHEFLQPDEYGAEKRQTLQKETKPASEETAPLQPCLPDERKNLWSIIDSVVAWIVVIVLFAAGLYLWVNPKISKTVGNNILAIFGVGRTNNVQLFDSGLVTVTAKKNVPGIAFTAITSQTFEHSSLGSMLIIQGVGNNISEDPASMLKVRAILYDKFAAVVDQKEYYAGNILTAEELQSLTNNDMLLILSIPDGRDFPNADIKTGEAVPFMVVFTNMPDTVQSCSLEVAEINGVTKE